MNDKNDNRNENSSNASITICKMFGGDRLMSVNLWADQYDELKIVASIAKNENGKIDFKNQFSMFLSLDNVFKIYQMCKTLGYITVCRTRNPNIVEANPTFGTDKIELDMTSFQGKVYGKVVVGLTTIAETNKQAFCIKFISWDKSGVERSSFFIFQRDESNIVFFNGESELSKHQINHCDFIEFINSLKSVIYAGPMAYANLKKTLGSVYGGNNKSYSKNNNSNNHQSNNSGMDTRNGSPSYQNREEQEIPF